METIKLDIIIQTEIYDGENGYIKALNSTELPNCESSETLFYITGNFIDHYGGEFSLTFGDMSFLM